MNYIYDILVNFKYPLMEFYEWNSDDDIENIKRIPFYKIKSNILCDLKYNKFRIKMDDIKGLTKIFNSKKTYNALVCTDGNEAIVFKFDNSLICIGKSKLLISEENEILDSSHMVKYTNIDYEIISKDNMVIYKTRKQCMITDYLTRYIDNIEDIDKLNYISYECFYDYRKVSKSELISYIRSEWNDKYYEIYDFLSNYSMNKM